MSHKSKHTAKENNLRFDSGRIVNKRSSGVFKSASATQVADSVLLYRLVFKGKKAMLLAVLLCLCFITQSVKFVEANDDVVALPEVQFDSQTIDPVENNVSQDNDPSLQPAGSTENTQTVTELPPSSNEDQTNEENLTNQTQTAANETQVLDNSTTSNPSNDELAEPTNLASSTDQEDVTASSSSESDNQNSTDPAPEASSTEEVILPNEQATSSNSNATTTAFSTSTRESETGTKEPPTTTNDDLVFTVESDTHFAFDKNECTKIEDGSFYCQKFDNSVVLDDSLLAAPDSDGDLEIYLVREGERYQITNNQVDDASPYYDELSNTIVWHRLLNDRYQIISYDVETGEEKQITNTKVNNMQPARNGQYTVWQRWVDNNWEVVLYDGQSESQITNSPRHDIAPHIRGPLVIWNSQSNDGSQELKTYDIKSRTQTTISDGEGVSVSNPRMVVMYEALYQNGDIVTKGFDLASGKVVPLEALPRQLPSDIPDPEPTEEVRALIQTKLEPKDAAVPQITPAISDEDATASTTDSTAKQKEITVDEETLDLRTLSTPELIEHLTEKDIATSTIPDLVIENESVDSDQQPASSTDEVIPDLIVAP